MKEGQISRFQIIIQNRERVELEVGKKKKQESECPSILSWRNTQASRADYYTIVAPTLDAGIVKVLGCLSELQVPLRAPRYRPPKRKRT